MAIARQSPKRIVLPELDDRRVIRAACAAAERGIARCVFVGDRERLARSANAAGVDLAATVDCIDPTPRLDAYRRDLVSLRAAKGMTAARAGRWLERPQVVATMMVALGEADGLVAGAATVTADVLRPALQLIGRSDRQGLVSSFFFMCFADGPKLFADCALNTHPDPEELAKIALQSAATATRFGLDPKVAMLSYSTGLSGSGPSVDVVRRATDLVRAADPGLKVAGPIQYDAAVEPRIARGKMPDSEVAGRANVLIFPDLNAGNIAYKAVQQAAGIVSVGPIIQGLRRPVNDVSRGATAEDIFFTIATTVIQAQSD